MALVLRKAVLPRNVSLLKCMKGRPLATAANRTNASSVSRAFASRCKKERKTVLTKQFLKTEHSKPLTLVADHCSRCKTIQMRLCMSCPSVASEAKTQQLASDYSRATTCFSLPKTRSMDQDPAIPKALATRTSFSHLYSKIGSILQPNVTMKLSRRGYAAKCPPPCPPPCPSPCPSPCGPCTLPPPCNTPPKCLQYMTGYYYYPYGFWFCGPYHVTGTCTPVGPCSPCKPSPIPCACTCAKCCACISSALSPVFGPSTKTAENIKHSFTSCQTAAPPVSELKTPCKNAPQCPCNYKMKNIQVPPIQWKPLACQNQSTSTRDKPTTSKSKTRIGISKFFPFRNSPPKSGPTQSASFCPYSTQPQPSCSVAKACMLNNMKTKSLQARPLAMFPKYPRRGVSGSFSRSFSDYYQRKASQIRKPGPNASMTCDDGSPHLESPRPMLSPEQRDWPYVEPNVFDYSQIPNFRRPYPYPHA